MRENMVRLTGRFEGGEKQKEGLINLPARK